MARSSGNSPWSPRSSPERVKPSLGSSWASCAQQSAFSSLQITDLSLRYAPVSLWNQLPESFRQSQSQPLIF